MGHAWCVWGTWRGICGARMVYGGHMEGYLWGTHGICGAHEGEVWGTRGVCGAHGGAHRANIRTHVGHKRGHTEHTQQHMWGTHMGHTCGAHIWGTRRTLRGTREAHRGVCAAHVKAHVGTYRGMCGACMGGTQGHVWGTHRGTRRTWEGTYRAHRGICVGHT